MPVTRTLGPATVVALHDGEGTFFQPREEAFAQVSPELWARADERDRGAVTADGQWLLRFRCFAIRHGDRVTLVDTGIGPADSLAASWAPVPGRLPAELAAAGIDPAEVDTVVLSHLHTDHIGWAVVQTPYFPNATYLLQRADAAALGRPELDERLFAPLTQTGQLRLVDGDVPISAGVTAIATPGHTPGHQSVLVEYGERQLLVTGDLLVHVVQLVAPETPYAHEMDPETARDSRTKLLKAGITLATPHLSEPFVLV
ncbi:MBL fold metallo-hydrolase [Phytohabitans sp. ZYX-F-186]|uniref:MBL fold metallo-hydrolase n=1 Tax=Phytohabitans maris TaxID=3071409 RepID=A0ABU0ZA28_9ACTN|nr:MBL fold metallo-hydrolase [Phytohabitans sp. ZYX-F-186]MDQ7903246.1 MBL fold metallo-hydrolase [Phytohabitans sp. ZYX-F-186]